MPPQSKMYCWPQLLATAPTIAIGPSPVVVQRPLDATNRFYRGA